MSPSPISVTDLRPEGLASTAVVYGLARTELQLVVQDEPITLYVCQKGLLSTNSATASHFCPNSLGVSLPTVHQLAVE